MSASAATTTPNNQSETVSPTPVATSIADELRNLNNQIRAKIVSDALKKGAIGAMTGAAFSFLIFKRKQTLHLMSFCPNLL